MKYFPKFLFRKFSNMTSHLILFFWITFLKKLKNRQLNRKRTDSQNHASFEIRRFVTLAASFDLWTRSLGAIYFWELGMTDSSFGPFFWSVKGIQWRMINFRWIWVFLKEKTANDSIHKEQEIMQTRQIWKTKREFGKTQTHQKNLTRKLRQTPLSGVYPHRSQF